MSEILLAFSIDIDKARLPIMVEKYTERICKMKSHMPIKGSDVYGNN